MYQCCTTNHTHRLQRRINGLQLPLNHQQVIGWIVLVVTGVLNFVILVHLQFEKLKLIAEILYMILYISHVISHLSALLLDPSEKELRKLETIIVPEFDRNVHAHVIENGRCHLCNIFTSSKKTKHCSLCNKCVDRFDHHCKWLNSCVGHRNYGAFIASVVTALLLSLMTSSLCLLDIVLFFSDPYQLSFEAQQIIYCTSVSNYTNITYYDVKFCKTSIVFLIGLFVFCGSALAIACALIHLFCFHVYISLLGISTYEYIVRSGSSSTVMAECIRKYNCCNVKLPGKLYKISKSKNNNNSKVEEMSEGDLKMERLHNSPVENNERNVASFIGILVNNELDKAKKIFLYDKNKIHPKEENS